MAVVAAMVAASGSSREGRNSMCHMAWKQPQRAWHRGHSHEREVVGERLPLKSQHQVTRIPVPTAAAISCCCCCTWQYAAVTCIIHSRTWITGDGAITTTLSTLSTLSTH